MVQLVRGHGLSFRISIRSVSEEVISFLAVPF